MARLVDQIKQVVAAFSGLGLRAGADRRPGTGRAWRRARDQRCGLLVDADDGEQVHTLLLDMGYACIHRSEDAANYLSGDEGLDLLYAHHPIARRLLADAESHVRRWPGYASSERRG